MKILFFTLLLAYIPCAQALNKCIDANGKTSYTDNPCPQIVSTKPVTQPVSQAVISPIGNSENQAGALSNAFSKYGSALRTGNWNNYLDSLSARQRAKVAPIGEKVMQISKSMFPSSLTFVNESISVSGDSGILKVKGMARSFTSTSENMSYGTINLVKEAGAWKIDQQAWSDQEWITTSEIQQKNKSRQEASCIGVTGKPESLAEQEMLKLLPGETQVAKFALPPNGSKEIQLASNSAQQITFRVAFNKALQCKYGADYPTGMSVDGGKKWLYSYYAGQQVMPGNGKINLAFKNNAQETMNFLVVSTIR
jgi:hypothetical protein